MNEVICCDCQNMVHQLPPARMIFADPPDFLGMKYDGFDDQQWKNVHEYRTWLWQRLVQSFNRADVIWWSVYHTHRSAMEYAALDYIANWAPMYEYRMLLWRFTFGQHRTTDCGNGFRPLMRFSHKDVTWNTDCIRVPSARTLKYKDKRANPAGRVPDDVWEFSRVCGTFHERRSWIPNQHPEALIERMVLMSTQPDDLVIDLFSGSGTVHRVCKRLGRPSISLEISKTYVDNILKEDEDEGTA